VTLQTPTSQVSGSLTPPQNLEAETAVLGAMLVSRDAAERVSDILKPSYFYKPENGDVFRAAIELQQRGQQVDSLTVAAELQRLGLLERIGGREYLAQLESSAGILSNAEQYARLVEETAVRRGLLSAAHLIEALGQDHGMNVDEALDRAGEEILRLANERTTQEAVHLGTALREYWDRIEKLHENPDLAPGVRTGFTDLDQKTGGLQPASLVIIAARPSVGKTSLALNIAQHVALKEKVPVGFFSLEMSRYELTQRLLSSEANIDSYLLRTGKLSENDWQKIANAMGTLSEGEMYIDDRPGVTVLEMRAKARRLKMQRGIGLVMIDYIQLMSGSGRSENRTQEVSEISRSLKRLSVELDIPVVALSQLSRAPEQRGDHRPQLSDLRESGSIEQDSDVVMFLYREGLHNPEVKKNKTELMLAKHRNGPTGEIPLLFLEGQTKFVSATRMSPQPGAAE
jgi:replicative DNA helicase